jgi:predicted TIM-barrel fold metal-dependent hydrolase
LNSVRPWDGIEIIDTMMNYPEPPEPGQHDNPLFAKRGAVPADGDPTAYMLGEMDRYKVSTAVINLGPEGGPAEQAARAHAKRFIATYAVDPNLGMEAVRQLEHAVKTRGARAAYVKPALLTPQVPINDKLLYPIYAKCVELDIPVFVLTGVPGPRVPSAPQKVELIDDVCWYFPDLKFVMRHGGEPWEDMAVKLMVKWPNLYYSTSAFSPKYYPKAIVDYANTRGADKIMYAGYFPVLPLDRIFTELAQVPFRAHVWPKFLRENAARLFKLA